MTTIPFADLALAQRIESFEAESACACTDAAARRRPDSGAEWIAVAGGWAAFSGKESPLTQAVSVGMDGPVSDEDLDAITSFFHSRGTSAHLEVCPMAHPTLIEALGRKCYRVSEFANVLVRSLDGPISTEVPSLAFEIRRARPEERNLWAETVAHGFADDIPVTDDLISVLSTFADRPGAQLWLAEFEGRVAGGGALAASEGLAALCGASTLPEHRHKGIQSVLMAIRLAEALRLGCRMSYTIAVPGSSSHRNAERQGFRVAYTRVKFTLPASGVAEA